MEKNNRWWEFYFVRYAMGTLVGSAFAYIVSRQLGLGANSISDIGVYEALCYLAAGLTYCYVASGPILVFHAARLIAGTLSKPLYTIRIAAAAILLAPVLGWILWVASCPYAWTISVGILIVTQFLLAGMAICNARPIYERYVKLSSARTTVPDFKFRSAQKAEVIESYKHMREHGNSFFILFLEIILALALYEIMQDGAFTNETTKLAISTVKEQFSFIVAAVVLWIMPSVSVWLFATQLEHFFIDENGR